MPPALDIVPDRCTGCMQCELACSWVHSGRFAPARSLIRVAVFDEEASYAPYTCLQCAEAWCMSACPIDAIGVDARTGAKIVNASVCVGCHLCTIACPFGTVFTEPDHGKAVKCDLCDGAPACVAACPTQAIVFRDVPTSGGWLHAWSAKVATAHAAATIHDFAAPAPHAARSEA